MLGSRGLGFDAGWLYTQFPFFSNLAEKNLLRVEKSVAKMASLVYERENCQPTSAWLLSNNSNALLFLFVVAHPRVTPAVIFNVRSDEKRERSRS